MASELPTAGDYTGSSAPSARTRWGRLVGSGAVVALWSWARRARRRWWAVPVVIAAASFLLLTPFDAALIPTEAWRAANIRGDLARELGALQQYGQGSISVLVAIAIWMLDPARRRRLVDWLLGAALAAAVVIPLKGLIGRPRPTHADPWGFIWPWGQYPLGPGRGVHHAWEFWVPHASQLWSLPSSHAAYAAVMSTFLSRVYPRIAPLAVFMAALVGVCRVLFGAHYPSDVVAGWAIGYLAATAVLRARAPAGGDG